MRQYTRLLRIALSILGSFLLAFMVLGLVFTFRIMELFIMMAPLLRQKMDRRVAPHLMQ